MSYWLAYHSNRMETNNLLLILTESELLFSLNSLSAAVAYLWHCADKGKRGKPLVSRHLVSCTTDPCFTINWELYASLQIFYPNLISLKKKKQRPKKEVVRWIIQPKQALTILSMLRLRILFDQNIFCNKMFETALASI